MARSRNIKPGLFKNEVLGDADPLYSLLFIGLWTIADKEGRLESRPKRIRAEIFPYRFDVNVSKALAWLKHESFITLYEVSGREYIQINNWKRHQAPHHKEADSEIPGPEFSNSRPEEEEKTEGNQQLTQAQAKHEPSMSQASVNKIVSCPTDSLIPDSGFSDSLIPDSGGLGGDAPGAEAPPPEKPKPTRFVPPTVDQVRAYCQERGNAIDPQKFVDHYEANGWMRGKSKIKDWKACIRTWEGNQKPTAGSRPSRGGRTEQQERELQEWLGGSHGDYIEGEVIHEQL